MNVHPAFIVLMIIATPMLSYGLWVIGVADFILFLWRKFVFWNNAVMIAIRFLGLLSGFLLLILWPSSAVIYLILLGIYLKKRRNMEDAEKEAQRPWKGRKLRRYVRQVAKKKNIFK